ncbi:MAG: hypothetical protein HGB02_06885 [Chlorobiaceae bacterium]|nr:hypothetical protein [Chlorobiaceae bacterium]
MSSFITAYGTLDGVEFRTLFSNGKTDGCLVGRKNSLTTPYGELIPQYEAEDMGRRPVKPLYFYKSGAIKSVALQAQTLLETPVGPVPAELVTFHESGSIKRVFPLDGRLSGFWTSKNEYDLAESITIRAPLGELTAKFIGLQFYESGVLKSVTLWPGEFLDLRTPTGEFRVRTGIAFHEDGTVRSIEPAGVVRVDTPLGLMTAYDNEPQGIHGDLNSLQFNPDGSIRALKTTADEILVIDQSGREHRFSPGLKDNPCGAERKVVVPLKVRFSAGRILFDDHQQSFNLQQCRVKVLPFDRKAADPSYSCAS